MHIVMIVQTDVDKSSGWVNRSICTATWFVKCLLLRLTVLLRSWLQTQIQFKPFRNYTVSGTHIQC